MQTQTEAGHSSVSTKAPWQAITMFGKINEITNKIGQIKCFPATLTGPP